LMMADMVNYRNSPADKTQRENSMRMWELLAEKQVERDFNHPCIFSWIIFNESWGLLTPVGNQKIYLPETKKWVQNMFHKFKADDPTRLVDDNSACKEDHTVSDFNSWHEYLPGYLWGNCLDSVCAKTYPGSQWNYLKGFKQTDVPMVNAECGGVWGYKDGAGDIDLTYDYHQMINEFKRHPKIAGYLFTELHDVTDEFNGYYRYNRSAKEFGLAELCPGMKFSDFASVNYVIPGKSFEEIYDAAQTVKMPITVSFLEKIASQKLRLATKVIYWNRFGDLKSYSTLGTTINALSYSNNVLEPLQFVTPNEECVATYCAYLIGNKGDTLHCNFVPFRVRSIGTLLVSKDTVVISKPAASYIEASWSLKNLITQHDSKFIGLGSGYVDYEFEIQGDKVPKKVTFIAELSSRMNQSKYFSDKSYQLDYFPNIGINCSTWGLNPNSFPQTDELKHPSSLAIEVDGATLSTVVLPDDPCDHRGLLSWFNQPHGSGLIDKKSLKTPSKFDTNSEGLDLILTKSTELLRSSFNLDGKLDEAGSYGYLVKVELPNKAIDKLIKNKSVIIRLRVDKSSDNEGGLSVFGKQSGRYPLEPSLVVIY
ncbi:MAG: glycoside hydrolase family 2 TIM barrel-domain containing protein, partial [Paludibacter sp.]